MANDTSTRPKAEKQRCAVTGQEVSRKDLISIDAVRPNLAERIRRDHPELADGALISRRELARYRKLYVHDLLKAESGDFSELEQQVAESLASHAILAENVEDDFDEKRTLGERMSDHLASFGGSWMFLIVFALFLAAWMALNIYEGDRSAFDPYPFILLNLVLSTIAAIQAPIIMMSQKRQEAKDRVRALNDYKVNLKAELEIRHLHEKIDHLLSKQWQRLAEIQELQLDTMSERRK